MKLFKVKLTGFVDRPIGNSLVVAEDPTSAYNKVREWLDMEDYGIDEDRELATIELLGDDVKCPNTPHQLFL